MNDPLFLNRRREALMANATQIGIDYVTAEPIVGQTNEWTLSIYFLPALNQAQKTVQPSSLTTDQIALINSESVTVRDISFSKAICTANPVTVHMTRAFGAEAAEQYQVRLTGVPNLDPFFAEAPVALRMLDKFDPVTAASSPSPPAVDTEINYLARDYESFRREMLDRLSLTLPQWRSSNPAEIGVVLVEALAQLGDQLSYFQDAAATEAYPGTARLRVSMKRHARLLNYPFHEGVNQRLLAQFSVNAGTTLERRTQLLTGCAKSFLLRENSAEYEQALDQQPSVFETLEQASLNPKLNEIQIYSWGAEDYGWEEGATSGVLLGPLTNAEGRPLLRVGDIIIIEEKRGPSTGLMADASPDRRHAVRLTRITMGSDPLGGSLSEPPGTGSLAVMTVTWHPEDALPFSLVVSKRIDSRLYPDISVARGNVVPADGGRTVQGKVPRESNGRRHLNQSPLVYAVAYDAGQARGQPVIDFLRQPNPESALPALPTLVESQTTAESQGREWRRATDLLNSGESDLNFVVEMANDRTAWIRFGDGIHGAKPPANSKFQGVCRVGNTHSHVGRDVLQHVVEKNSGRYSGISAVRNPLPSVAGLPPEPLTNVPLYAPAVVNTQLRCVTPDDYKIMAEQFPGVREAGAALRWTGSWQTAVVSVLRMGDQPVTDSFLQELQAHLGKYRMLGSDVIARAPRYVPLSIALTIQVQPNYFPDTVKESLLEAFSNRTLDDGYFRARRFGFGQSVYLSDVVRTAERVAGVRQVELGSRQRFRRMGGADNARDGVIPIGALEVARLDNDPREPANGRIEFHMRVGPDV